MTTALLVMHYSVYCKAVEVERGED